jgi:hypothetical protein
MLRNFLYTSALAVLTWLAASSITFAQVGGSMSSGSGGGTGGGGGIGGGGGGGGGGFGGGGSGASSSGFFSGSSGSLGGGSSGSGFFGGSSGTGSGFGSSGSSSSFSGAGGFGSGSGGGLGTTSTGVNRADPFYSYFNNPMGFGVPKTGTSTTNNSNGSISPSKSSVSFGAPLYGTALTTSTGAGSGRTLGASSATATTGKMGGYPPATGTATPLSKAPVYSIVVGFPTRPPAPAQLQSNLAGVLARSTALGNDRRIAISGDGATVVLRGTVSNEHDRRLAEAMTRLTPGVHDVRNELQIQAANPTP